MSSIDDPFIAAFFHSTYPRLYWVHQNQEVYYADCPDILTAYMYLHDSIKNNKKLGRVVKSGYSLRQLRLYSSETHRDRIRFHELTLPENITP